MTFKQWFGLLIVAMLTMLILPSQAQSDDRTRANCGERPLLIDLPVFLNTSYWCHEIVNTSRAKGELAYTALAVDEANRLYATVPFEGTVVTFEDDNQDGTPDTPRTIADEMRLPNALAYYDEALYILGDGAVYRLVGDTLVTLVDDLPQGRGFIARGLAVDDSGIYVGVPMPCDFCIADDERAGTVMRFTLEGDSSEILAEGLRFPAGFLLEDGVLYLTDTARDGLFDTPQLDEINVIDLDSDVIPHFGFPYCVGRNNQPDLDSDFDCDNATSPILTLPTQSTPVSLTRYPYASRGDVMTDDWIVTLSGSIFSAQIRGYAVVALRGWTEERIAYEPLIPQSEWLERAPESVNAIEAGVSLRHSDRLNLRNIGFYPHRVYDTVVDSQGWIYVSWGGRIIVLR